MRVTTASLAKAITWDGSKQSYFTARWMVDKDLVNDAFHAYGYFRWADDVIDISSQNDEDRIAFVKRQRKLIDALYNGEDLGGVTPEEEIIATLITHDRKVNSGLQSYILNMLAILEFDAHRRGGLITEQEYVWYSERLAKSVIDGLQYFICNGHPYPKSKYRYHSAIAAHITHMLRDMYWDIKEGYINIPQEYLKTHGINPEDIDSLPFRAWVKSQVNLARRYFKMGKHYIKQMDVLRYKIVCYWYCARFESLLDTIERESYCLRAEYPEQKKLASWMKIIWVGISLVIQHAIGKVFFMFPRRTIHEYRE